MVASAIDIDGLLPRVAHFVQEYVKDRNGAAAARRAGYSVKTASEQASRLLAKPNVQAAVEKYTKTANEHAGIDAEWVRRELKNVYDIAMKRRKETWKKHPDTGRNIRLVNKSDPDLVSATRALENLGRLTAVGAFTDRSDVTTKGKSIKPAKKQVMVINGVEVEF